MNKQLPLTSSERQAQADRLERKNTRAADLALRSREPHQSQIWADIQRRLVQIERLRMPATCSSRRRHQPGGVPRFERDLPQAS